MHIIEKMREIVKLTDELTNMMLDKSMTIEKPIVALTPPVAQDKTTRTVRPYHKKSKRGPYKKNKSDLDDVPEKDKKKHRKPPTCKNCWEVGHRSHTCPNEKRENPAGEDEEKVVNTRNAILTLSEPLTEEQYDDVHTSSDHGMSVLSISNEIGVSVRDVNLALQSFTYENYLKRKG